MFGVMAYPAQGIYKSVKALSHATVQQIIKSGRTAMMAEETRQLDRVEHDQAISRFRDIVR